MQDMPIWDCFIFYNELDLLEIRLHELYDHVDHFVLVEATRTFVGKPKPLYFQDSQDRFSQFSDKLIHIVVDGLAPERTLRRTGDVDHEAFEREHIQRNAIVRGLASADRNDIILISDVDEIPKPCAIHKTKQILTAEIARREEHGFQSTQPPVYLFEQDFYYYYLNNQAINKKWYGTKATLNFQMLPQSVRTSKGPNICDGGWHFSFLGNAQQILQKIEAYSHQELNIDMFTGALKEGKLNPRSDLFGRRDHQFRPVEVGASFPSFIRGNTDKLSHLIL
jgi:beta-1,4-mannosyl-glycoprotein beta-1,4-N-acetylglucosaminyltransferase